MQPKRVLLTGAAGGVGIHVLRTFLKDTDWDMVVLDSFRHKGYRDRLEVVFKDNPEYRKRVTIFQHDLVCAISPELRASIGPINHILHLAALSDVFFSVESPVYTIQNNVNSMLTMLEYARVSRPDIFLYFSTDEVYGPVPKGGAHEEWDTHRPSNAYAASKAASEDIAYAYWRSYGVPLVITNTMNNFGEMQSASKFPAMVQSKLEKGEKITIHGNETDIGTRFYIHSAVVADALIKILNFGATRHEQGQIDEPDRYHIVGERAVSNLEMAKMIADMMGKELDYELVDFHHDNPAHDIHYGLKNTNLDGLWKPAKGLEEALKDTIEWQKNNPEWLR